MIKIGITGSIASGKTTASKILSYKRGPLFSADKTIKKFYTNNNFKKLLIKELNIEKKLNLKDSLRKKILNSKLNIKTLEKIIHPMVRKEMKKFTYLHKKKKRTFYEIPLLITVLSIAVISGSFNILEIIDFQIETSNTWNIFILPLGAVLFLVTMIAEVERIPFDMPEAEAELVAGFQVEYSSTPFLLLMIGELMTVVLMCTLISILFFGGWLSPIPFLPDGVAWLILKVLFFFFLFAMVKAIVPRFRYDQLMRLGWKVFLPMSLGWVVVVATLAQFNFPGYARWVIEGV